MAHENENDALPVLSPPRTFRFHYPYRQSIAISFFQLPDPPDIDIKIFREDVMKLEMPDIIVHLVINYVFGNSNLLVYFKDAGTYEDDPSKSLSVVALRRPHTEVITWFSCSHSLDGLLFHLEQKALISVPAHIRPEENPPYVNDDEVVYYLRRKRTDLHTRLSLLLRRCFPSQLLLRSEPEQGQEGEAVSSSDEHNDEREVEIAETYQAAVGNDEAAILDESNNEDVGLQATTDAFDNGRNYLRELDITDDYQAPAEDDEAAASNQSDIADDDPQLATDALNPAIPPDYYARLAPFRPALVRDYTRLQDNLRDSVDPGEQLLAAFNHCKSLADYQRDKQVFLAASRGERKTVEEWRDWAVLGHGLGGRHCRDGRARQWAKTFHAMGWIELKDE